jgi:spore maturation protein CgeB
MHRVLLVAGLLDAGDIPLILVKNFEDLGHKVCFLPVDRDLPFLERYLHSKGRRTARLSLSLFSKRLHKKARTFSPDILLLYGSNWGVLPEMLERFRHDFGCKVVLWEGNLQLWRWFQGEALRHYDHVLVNDSYAIPMLTGPARLKDVFHLPFNMCDPDIHRPLELSDKERHHYGSDIGFIGMGHPERREFFEHLTDFNLRLWGKDWGLSEKLRPFFVDLPVGMEEKIRIYQCARINVNIQSKNYQIDGISAKIFEIASCGGFFLTERKKDLSLFLKDEEDMISFSSIDELKSKIAYYLSHAKERTELADKIRDKVVNNFTYKHKLKELMSIIKA